MDVDPSWAVRAERSGDRAAVFGVQSAAFPSPAEARLVDRLREQATPLVSLVADTRDGVQGHVMFTPVTHEPSAGGPPADLGLFGLAPLAVAPDWQGMGLGAGLAKAGLKRVQLVGARACVVLGDPKYYRRFGFRAASDWGLSLPFPVPTGAFQAIEFQDGALGGAEGTIQYHPAFADLEE